MNVYLFHEFGVEGHESDVSASWPFALSKVAENSLATVFEFEDDELYFALAGPSLNFVPAAGMTAEDILVQVAGAAWIADRDPIGLDTSVIGDADVPPGDIRRQELDRLASQALSGEGASVLEGLFLKSTRSYLALVEGAQSRKALVAGLSDTPLEVPFPEASPWRRLAWGVGIWNEGPSN